MLRITLICILSLFMLPVLSGQDPPVKGKTPGSKSDSGEQRIIIGSRKSKPKVISIKKKEKKDIKLDVVWLAPLEKKVKVSAGFLEIMVKVTAPHNVEKKDVVFYHNNRQIGSKADEVSLFGNVEQTEFTYKNKVFLSEGANKIQLGIKTDSGIKKFAPKYFSKEGDMLTETFSTTANLTSVSSGLSIYWVEPDPLGRKIVKKDRELAIRLILKNGMTIDRNAVSIVHNNIIRQPSFKSKLKKISSGKYIFEDFIQLNEMYDMNEISVRVNTLHGLVESEKLLVDFTPFRPNLYITTIGTETNLAYTGKDAEDFGDLYKKQGGKYGNRLFNTVNVQSLLGSDATAGEIKGRIEELKVKLQTGNISENDVIVLFISSHGFLLDGQFRIQGDDYDPARKRSTSVSYKNDIAAILEELPCKKLVFIDACHSGGGGARANVADLNYEIKKLNEKKMGLTTIVSSREDEESYEDVVWQNGAFTEAIIQGLENGLADKDKNAIVTIDELFNFISGHVAEIVSKVKRKPQHPAIIKNELGDLAIYVVQ